MSINKTQKNRFNTNLRKIKKPESKKSTKSIIKMIIYIMIFFIITLSVLLIVIYNKYLRGESIDELKNYKISETSILYDRNGKELYRFYDGENRTYVDFEKISKNMINAIVAGEDKRFWENPGVDIIGLIRAGIVSVTSGDRVAGTSTLTQQLIRNTIIKKKTNETMAEGIDRKVKEIFLSYNLTKSMSKEKILELYLNKIEFGHNSFGVESASERFFNKKAVDLNPFEASVLASLPKGPTYYSPYNRSDRLIGFINFSEGVKDENGKIIIEKLITKEEIDTQKELVNNLKTKISKLIGKNIGEGSNKYMICSIEKSSIKGDFQAQIDKDGCLVLDYANIDNFISSIEVKSGEKFINYNVGRNAYILQRMLEDKYITFDQFKNAIIEGIGYKFNKQKESIVAPHFVFYVKEYLEEKYGKDSVSKDGLKIYTTIDLEVQKKAEEIVKNQAAKNAKKFNAKNSALISIDNKTGGIIAMVGNEDYFNEEGKGNVNVITSKLQPGSSFKPFVYSIAMNKNQIGTKTPVYDVETNFGGNYKPKNFDGKFMGKISISTALNHSRNIPAVKMYFMTDGAKEIIDFMRKLGVNITLDEKRDGASIALGVKEMTPLELAKAYTVYANMGDKVEVTPILKIVDSKGNIIEELKEGKRERVITQGQAFMINSILSDSSTRPSGWNSYLSIGRQAAVKTGTSTKPVKEKNGKEVQYPANLFVAGYTPQVTTIVWSGNITGETMKYTGSGLEASSPIWKEFMNFIHKGKKEENWSKPDDVKKVTISEISGLLANPDFENFLVSSYFINPPKKIDNSYKYVAYDALCNGKITEETPETAIKRYVTVKFQSLKPDNKEWERGVQLWASETGYAKYGAGSGVSIKNEVCQRNQNGGSNILIGSDLSSSKSYTIGGNPIKIGYSSENSPIIKVEILINGAITQSINIENKNSGVLNQNIFIPEKFSNQKVSIEIRAINSEYYSNSERKDIHIGITPENTENNNTQNNSNQTETNSSGAQETKPENTENNEIKEEPIVKKSNFNIAITNPKSGKVKINPEDYFNLRFTVSPKESFSSVNVSINGVNIASLGNDGNYVLPINQSQKLEKGISNLKIQAVGTDGSVKEKMLQVEIL